MNIYFSCFNVISNYQYRLYNIEFILRQKCGWLHFCIVYLFAVCCCTRHFAIPCSTFFGHAHHPILFRPSRQSTQCHPSVHPCICLCFPSLSILLSSQSSIGVTHHYWQHVCRCGTFNYMHFLPFYIED